MRCYADTDFFLALLKPRDWLKSKAERLLERHRGELWTSGTTLIELMLVGKRLKLDVVRLVVAVLSLVEVRCEDTSRYLTAAQYVQHEHVGVFDAVHAAQCGTDPIVSSDAVFDRLGLRRIPLRGAA